MKFYPRHTLILIFFLTGLIGCSKNKFEVYSIDDKDYLSIRDNIDELPIVKIPDSSEVYDEIITKFHQLVIDSSSRKNLTNEPFEYSGVFYDFMCRIYLNEKGKIDKLNFIIDSNPDFKSFIIDEIKKWNFIPAKKDGKNVKFQFDWEIKIQELINIASSLPNENFPLAKINTLRTEVELKKMIKNLPDEMPEPIGGIKAIQEKIHYPEIAKSAGIEGKVLISAFIDENGNVIKTKILKKLGHGLDAAAANAVAQTKFKPAEKNNKKVEAQVLVPVLFKLDSSK